MRGLQFLILSFGIASVLSLGPSSDALCKTRQRAIRAVCAAVCLRILDPPVVIAEEKLAGLSDAEVAKLVSGPSEHGDLRISGNIRRS